MNNEDLPDFQQRKEDGNMTNRRMRNPINEITGIKSLIRHIVDAIQPSRSGISHKIPIKIYGEVAITYKLVQY